MQILGGTDGQGFAYLNSVRGELEITSSKGRKLKTLELSKITSFETVGNQTSGKLGKAGIGAAAGFLLAGPLAGLAGLALGASGKNNTNFTFSIEFSTGDAFMIRADPTEYMAFKTAVGSRSSIAMFAAEHSPKKSPTRGRKIGAPKKAPRPAMIKGRENLTAPPPDGALAGKILSFPPPISGDDYLRLDEESKRTQEYIFGFFGIQRIMLLLNNFKWRYFDQTLTEKEVADCVICIAAERFRALDVQESLQNSNTSIIESYTQEIGMLEEALGRFFGSALGTKSELRARLVKTKEELVKREEDVEKYIVAINNCSEVARLCRDFCENLLGKSIESDDLTRLKEHYSKLIEWDKVDKVKEFWALKYFKNVRVESKILVNEANHEGASEKHAISIEDRLQRLNELLSKELISNDEFSRKKADILKEL